MSQSEEVVPAGMTDTNTASAAAAAADTIPPPPEPESEQKMEETTPKKETETDTDTVESQPEPPVVISNSRNSRPTYRYDPNKITLRFLFANRDGLTVTVTCNPSDTVGQVKESLISVWPEGTNSKMSVDRVLFFVVLAQYTIFFFVVAYFVFGNRSPQIRTRYGATRMHGQGVFESRHSNPPRMQCTSVQNPPHPH